MNNMMLKHMMITFATLIGAFYSSLMIIISISLGEPLNWWLIIDCVISVGGFITWTFFYPSGLYCVQCGTYMGMLGNVKFRDGVKA